jgi:acylphosphatase
MKEAQILFSGRVQGVGFRYRTLQVLAPTKLTGSVRNLRDGRVELIVQGEPHQIEQALEQVRAELGGLIESESWAWRTPSAPCTGFRILPTAAEHA